MTREQAEAKALELYPTSLDSDRIFQINKQRKAYLKGWEDMEEVNTYTAEYVKASKLRKEYSEATNIQDRGIYHYSEWLEAKIEADTELREAAEKVVEVYESDAYADDIIELLNPLEELEKALK